LLRGLISRPLCFDHVHVISNILYIINRQPIVQTEIAEWQIGRVKIAEGEDMIIYPELWVVGCNGRRVGVNNNVEKNAKSGRYLVYDLRFELLLNRRLKKLGFFVLSFSLPRPFPLSLEVGCTTTGDTGSEAVLLCPRVSNA
jgi:hypothetical protein